MVKRDEIGANIRLFFLLRVGCGYGLLERWCVMYVRGVCVCERSDDVCEREVMYVMYVCDMLCVILLAAVYDKNMNVMFDTSFVRIVVECVMRCGVCCRLG